MDADEYADLFDAAEVKRVLDIHAPIPTRTSPFSGPNVWNSLSSALRDGRLTEHVRATSEESSFRTVMNITGRQCDLSRFWPPAYKYHVTYLLTYVIFIVFYCLVLSVVFCCFQQVYDMHSRLLSCLHLDLCEIRSFNCP